MALARRIIPCLDVHAGRVVKGVHFVDLRDAGDPQEAAARYDREQADELVLLDITATWEKRGARLDTVQRCADVLRIPFTVGGGVRGLDDALALLDAGADKVAVNSAALRDPTLLSTLSDRFGRQCVVAAIDTRSDGQGGWQVFMDGGRRATERQAVAWASEAARRGAGEILLTSMDRDGTGRGYDLELTARVAEAVEVPVIASGGVGRPEHFLEAFRAGASGALAASIFHIEGLDIRSLRAFLRAQGVDVRVPTS